MSEQQSLALIPIKHAEIDQVGMGVLPNGETYLSLQGLARFCGLAPSSIIELSGDWSNGVAQTKQRGQQITQLIKEWADTEEIPNDLYVPIEDNSSITGVIHAVPEQICMAILDYYAHYAQSPKKEALNNYRTAARYGLRRYIYDRVGYSEVDRIAESWKLFQERIVLNESPHGYFTMFDEATSIIASLIRNNITVDDSIMVDASLGIHWSKYWKNEELDQKYGNREKVEHKFPAAFRQLDPEIWAYPNDALSEFRNWFQNTYLLEKYPAYLRRKTSGGSISVESIPILLSAVLPPSLESKIR